MSEQTAIIALYSTNWLVFITEMECLLRGTDWIYVIQFIFICEILRNLIIVYSPCIALPSHQLQLCAVLKCPVYPLFT